MDYQCLNSCLQGQHVPLPVIEDLLQRQAGSHLWPLSDRKDGFYQMPLLGGCRHLTAFFTHTGKLE